MFVEESEWIRTALARLSLPPGASVLDIGSSTRSFRTQVQPHIDANVFAPLRERGVRVVHLDAKEDDGVDVVWDVTDPKADPGASLGERFDVVLCTNLLEHVTDRGRTARVVLGLVRPGGCLLVTVPRAYRRHLDPIDTMYRPSPRRLAGLFTRIDRRVKVIDRQTVRIDGPQYYRHHPSGPWLWQRREQVRRRLPPLRWRQACVLLRADA